MGPDVKQSENSVSGNGILAGRDVNIWNLPSPKVDTTKINKLLQRYREEKATNKQFSETINRLAYFKNYAENEVRRTLEEKLIAGARAAQVRDARRMKELFARKLLDHEMYESAQAADAYLLGEVCTRFNNVVYPAIAAGSNHTAVASLIESHVIEPIMTMLKEDDVLDHYREEIFGMIYFLTGNCHINWD